VTLIQGVPWTIRLCFSLLYFRRLYPGWLYDWLVISYSLLFIGQIRACGYLIFSDRNRSELLAIKSCSAKRIPFLPPRNEMVPNTAHILLHLATAAT
jgi:hypothetical protein